MVVIICPDDINGDSWSTATLQTSTGMLSGITQGSASPTFDMSKCFILAPTSLSYDSSTSGDSIWQDYVSTEYSNAGTTSIGSWEDVTIAVNIMGFKSFASYFNFENGMDEFFVTYNGDLVSQPDNIYIVSFFAGDSLTQAIANGYQLMDDPLTYGLNNIVLGSSANNLPILGRIDDVHSLQGTLISHRHYPV